MKRAEVKHLFLSLAFIVSLHPSVILANDRPNIILFFIDDMGVYDWGGSGNPYILTPNIDRIGRDGVVFTQGYVNASNCAPSRCALLTGQYPPRNHFYNVKTIHRGNKRIDRLTLRDVPDGLPSDDPKVKLPRVPDERITFAEALKKAGYTTAMYGKWHVSGAPPKGAGFDGGVSPSMQGFDDVMEGDPVAAGWPEKRKGTDPKHVFSYSERANRFIEQSSEQEKPFLIYMAHHAVHRGNEFTKENLELFKARKTDNPYHNSPEYAAMMYDTDRSIGMILDKLDQLGIYEDTVVIFLSDNGGVPKSCTQQPLRAYKGAYYEGGIRVPFIISWPGRFRHRTTATPVMAIDLYPTMLELAGITDIPGHINKQPIDGRSLVRLLNDPKALSVTNRSLFWYFPAYLAGNPAYTGTRLPSYRQLPVSVIRKGDWKLIMHLEEWSLDGGREKIDTNKSIELYNLAADPSEKDNLALKNKERRDQLLNELLAWQRDIAAPIPREPNATSRRSPGS
jgi:arylsulfatase A-like enzyme